MNRYFLTRRGHRAAERAFSLLELLVAVVIVGVLAALLITAAQQMREKGWEARCLANLRTAGALMALYCNDHQMQLPPAYTTTIHSNGSRSVKVWYQYLDEYGPRENKRDSYLTCPPRLKVTHNYHYAFERRLSESPLWKVRQIPADKEGIRWLLIDATWYFMEKSHRADGDAGTKVADLRHSGRANLLLADFSVHGFSKPEINNSLYLFKQFPLK